MADNSKMLLLGGAAAAAYWWFYMRVPTPVAAAAAPAAAVPPPNPNAIQGANTVAGIQARVIASANPPAAGLPVDTWGYTLNQELAKSGAGSAPDPMTLFSAASPGFDRSQPVTAAQYWAVMGPALKSQLGLSGFRGLGLYGWAQ